MNILRTAAFALLLAGAWPSAIAGLKCDAEKEETMTSGCEGMWVTADGRIRHELLPGGRYEEKRNGGRVVYRGRYWITGNHIDYADDTGFTADGEFIDNVLYHAGMIMRRETPD